MVILNTPPVPNEFDGLPYPRDMIILFFQNDCKGWGNDYQDPLLGEFRRFRKYCVMKTGRGWLRQDKG